MTKEERIVKFKEFFSKGFEEVNEVWIENLTWVLDQGNYFSLPASIKYHGSYEGGLFDHSYKVAENLVRLTDSLGLNWKRKCSPYVIGLFHDLCKTNDYVMGIDYITNQRVFDYNNEKKTTGHGDWSIILLQKALSSATNLSRKAIYEYTQNLDDNPYTYLYDDKHLITDLTMEEILCIRWHMGAFDDKENWKFYSNAIEQYPNVLYAHTADMMASKIDKI